MHTNEDDLAFIEAIRQAPYDDAPRLVYADWLEERDDPRAEYIRKMYEIIGHIRAGTSYDQLDVPFRELVEGYSAEWRNIVSKRFDVTLEWFDVSKSKIVMIKVIRELTAIGLSEAKQLSEAVPLTVREELSLESAFASRQALQYGRVFNPPDFPPADRPRLADVSLSESIEIVASETADGWIQQFRDFPNKRLRSLDRLRHLLPHSELVGFLTTQLLDRSLPDGLRTMMMDQLTRLQNLTFTERGGVLEVASTIATREDAIRVRSKAIDLLALNNDDRQYDPLLLEIVQNREEVTTIRQTAVVQFASRVSSELWQNHETILLPMIIDETQPDSLRQTIFALLIERPCEHLHELFRSLQGGMVLTRWVNDYFDDLESRSSDDE